MVCNRVGRAVLTGAFVFAVLAGARSDGLAQTPPRRDTFSAKTVNMSVGSGQDLKMDVIRWSTDEERNAVLSALKDKNDKVLADAVSKAPSLGSIWTNETLGYAIHFAYRDMLANGSERVILVADGRFGSWTGQVWKPLHPLEGVDYPFSVIELRLNRTGTGEGKMSLTSKVVADETGKTLVLADYDAAPILLRPVKRESGPSK
jgi:hypothetical protein